MDKDTEKISSAALSWPKAFQAKNQRPATVKQDLDTNSVRRCQVPAGVLSDVLVACLAVSWTGGGRPMVHTDQRSNCREQRYSYADPLLAHLSQRMIEEVADN